MIRKDNRFDAYAYRVASKPIAAAQTLTSLEEGKWVTLNASGEVVLATGDSKKAWILLTSDRAGRDNVSTQNYKPRASYLHGAWELTVSNNPDSASDTAFDSTQTYAVMTPLSVNANGILTPYVAGSAAGSADPIIVAYVMAPVANTTDLRICSAN